MANIDEQLNKWFCSLFGEKGSKQRIDFEITTTTNMLAESFWYTVDLRVN
jgi:hypothetical protein